ncbi:2-hydroxyacid dehydrogenase [Aureimonas fodinaquatilis]|uniref:2-hydroxyacid dehydrogenase n=1 Tax=Aureimonas fodinaquatilis TaxID=2565783 RepID=A0A5B0E3Z2_9HYPH|nr:2-hydroxyacid dehydrogenase [Aureimonas fodinaquatilis]KAA0972119.1 2-hydroxyacid dehydrogenase [Aureimonas fodinaquatilis]
MAGMKNVPVLVPAHFHAGTRENIGTIFDRRDFVKLDLSELSAGQRSEIRAIASFANVSADMMDALPNLEIISSFGVGYDSVDAKHAAAKGIMVTNTPDVLTEEVADTALGLLLMTVRELGQAEQYVRKGLWAKNGPYRMTPTTLRGRTVGIMGLGRIGLSIARRLEGFGVKIAYHNRSQRNDVSYDYYPTLVALAEAVDTLIVIAPGGSSTDKAVNATVLKALGKDGVLINIGRGSTVDEAALIEALQAGTIHSAGLDVFENEPNVPQALIDLPNTVLLPHVGSASMHTRKAMGDLVLDNLQRWFSGTDVATPVDECVKADVRRHG